MSLIEGTYKTIHGANPQCTSVT